MVREVAVGGGPMLRVTVDVSGRRLSLRARGPLAPAVRPLVERANAMFASGNPIRSGGEYIVFSTWLPPITGGPFRRLLRAQLRREVLGRPTPEQVSVGVMDRCPNRCLHCAAEGMAPGALLTDLEVGSVIRQSLRMGCYMVTFDGGEPMLRGSLPTLAEAVPAGQAVTAAFTSGYGFSQPLARRLAGAGLHALRVSVDFPEARGHDRFRGRRGSFAEACYAVETAARAGLNCDLFAVIGPHNIDRLDEFHALAARLGAVELSFYEIVAVGRWRSHADEVLTRRDVARLGAFERRVNRRGELPRVTSLPTMMGPGSFGCFAGRRWLHVTPTGDVLPCAYLPLSAGNVREEPLERIWRRMAAHSDFRAPAPECMMRDPAFRRRYLGPVAQEIPLPAKLR